jgi:hypothetical protein
MTPDGNFAIPPVIGREHGEEEPVRCSFNDQERAMLMPFLAPIMGLSRYGMFVRSDERTAVGSGGWDTVRYISEAKRNVISCIEDILMSQFQTLPRFISARLGLEPGIGIMLMPAVGVRLTDNSLFAPPVSLAAFTSLKNRKLVLACGEGFGGGVSRGARSTLWAPHTPDHGFHYPAEGHILLDMIILKAKTPLATPQILTDEFFMHFGLKPEKIVRLVTRFAQDFLQLAERIGKDIYGEAQLVDLGLNSRPWAVTQLTDIETRTARKPEGMDLVSLRHGASRIIGTGVVECTTWDGKPDRGETTDAEILFVTEFDPRVLPYTPNVKAILLKDVRAGDSDLAGHIGGIYRELGIIVLNLSDPQFDLAFRTLRSLPSGTMVNVWAEQINGRGGIVIPG